MPEYNQPSNANSVDQQQMQTDKESKASERVSGTKLSLKYMSGVCSADNLRVANLCTVSKNVERGTGQQPIIYTPAIAGWRSDNKFYANVKMWRE